ncbi:sialidase family protein [Cohnella sp. GCM10012308]|uniref:sialidase family protein n=1 Tax=Cohnella sp. GCM10012308 TaxID=3317329 RepID=UPI00360963A8
MEASSWKVRPVAKPRSKVCESPGPAGIYCFSPGILTLPSGRIVVTMDYGGPGIEGLAGVKKKTIDGVFQGNLFISDDAGYTWTHICEFPFYHARPFQSGSSLYVLGHADDLMIMRSDDEGLTWSEPCALTKGEHWHQAPCNVLEANGHVYLVMERVCEPSGVWPVGNIAPVLMRGRIGADLMQRDNWTFASEIMFKQAVDTASLNDFGVPFYEVDPVHGDLVAPGRHCSPPGWLETNVVQFVDPDHYWTDPTGHTFHLWMRAHTAGTGYAAVMKVVEREDGTMTTQYETVPSGRRAVYVPCPGGQMKFHILYDERSRLYWLLSTQSTDSMTRAERLPEGRFHLPNNERQRLQLHFSRNCIDWCFAALVDAAEPERESRHYASMAIFEDDLYVLSRSGDERASGSHNGNMITFHVVSGFRDLIY